MRGSPQLLKAIISTELIAKSEIDIAVRLLKNKRRFIFDLLQIIPQQAHHDL